VKAIAPRPVHNRSFHFHPRGVPGQQLADETVPDRDLGFQHRIKVPSVDGSLAEAQSAVLNGQDLIFVGEPIGQAGDRRRLGEIEPDHHPVFLGDIGQGERRILPDKKRPQPDRAAVDLERLFNPG